MSIDATPVIGISDLTLIRVLTDTKTQLLTDDENMIDMRGKLASRAYAPQMAEGKFYYSNQLKVNPKFNKGGTITFVVSDVTPEERKAIFNQSENTEGVTFGTGNDVPNEFIVAYKIKKTADIYELQKYGKVSFSVPNENAQTEGESIDAQNCELVGIVTPLNYEVETADGSKKGGSFQFFMSSDNAKYEPIKEDWFTKGTVGIVKATPVGE